MKPALVFILIYNSVLLSLSGLKPSAQDRVTITFADVGQGDAALITTPNGKRVVIDGGPNYEIDIVVNNKIGIPVCKLDAIFLSHPHDDHLKGLTKLLRRCKLSKNSNLGFVTFNDVVYSAESWSDFLESIGKNLVKKSFTGDKFVLDDVIIKVLWPTKTFMQKFSTGPKTKNVNNMSTVLAVTYKNNAVIFTGELEAEYLNKLSVSEFSRANGLKIYKVPHHGAKTSHSPAVVANFKPEYCVISVGTPNFYGHPVPAVVEDLKSHGCKVLRTDETGTIEFLLKN